MAKDGKNAGVSVLVLIGSLLYLYVASQALSANGLVATLSGSVLGGFAGVLWAVALIASIGLLFGSLGSFAWGWMEESVKMAMKGGQIAGVALLVVSVALGASQTWIGIVVVGFVLNWLGIAMAWGSTGKK